MTGHRTGGAPRPTAGALRLVEARTPCPTTVDVTAYTEAITAHCPYLRPSVERGLTGWTVYEIAGDVDAVEAEVFWAAVQVAERIRTLMTRPRSAIACENVVITGSMEPISHRAVMGWPHWALKHLYGPVGLMVGKFEHGEERRDRQGRRIPAPPVSFMPVRTAIRPIDPRFLKDTPDLADALASAVDDGRDVFDHFHLPHDWKQVKQWAGSLPLPPRPWQQPSRRAAAPSS